jgi:hypothetical protein
LCYFFFFFVCYILADLVSYRTTHTHTHDSCAWMNKSQKGSLFIPFFFSLFCLWIFKKWNASKKRRRRKLINMNGWRLPVFESNRLKQFRIPIRFSSTCSFLCVAL